MRTGRAWGPPSPRLPARSWQSAPPPAAAPPRAEHRATDTAVHQRRRLRRGRRGRSEWVVARISASSSIPARSSGQIAAGTLVTATLKTATGVIKGTAHNTSGGPGWVDLYLEDTYGNPVFVAATDILELQMPGLITIPVVDLRASIDAAAQTARGFAPANVTNTDTNRTPGFISASRRAATSPRPPAERLRSPRPNSCRDARGNCALPTPKTRKRLSAARFRSSSCAATTTTLMANTTMTTRSSAARSSTPMPCSR